MASNPFPFHLLLLIGAFGFSLLFNQVLLQKLHHWGTKGHQVGQLRWASQSKPTIGGIAMYVVFVGVCALYAFLARYNIDLVQSNLPLLFAVGTMGFVIGLMDDLRPVRPILKLAVQVVCALLMVAGGVFISISNSWIVNTFFTLFWVIGIMNSLNMLDNMDGIAAITTIGILTCIALVIYLTGGQSGFYAAACFGLIGAVMGFLWHNRYPSRLFMGDSGSLFLGAVLAMLGIVFLWQTPQSDTDLPLVRQFVLPLLVFLLPITDTATVTVHRILRGQSPAVGGRDHTTHHLVYCGLSDGQVSIVFVLLSLILLGFTCYFAPLVLGNAWRQVYGLFAIGICLLIFVGIQIAYLRGKNSRE